MKLVQKVEAMEQARALKEKEIEEKNSSINTLRRRTAGICSILHTVFYRSLNADWICFTHFLDLLKESVAQGKARMDAEMKYEAIKSQLGKIIIQDFINYGIITSSLKL